MFIPKRHPLMTSALRAEKGVVGTYALAVVAVVGSLATAAFFWGGLGIDGDAISALGAGEPVPWMEVAPQRAAGTEQSAAPAVAPAEDDEAPPADSNAAGETRESAEMEAVTIYMR